MRTVLFLLFLCLGGCAELRSGWVKVDFMEGRPSEFVVCQLKHEGEDLSARCVSLESVEREMHRRGEFKGDL